MSDLENTNQDLSEELKQIEAAKKDLKDFEPLYNQYFDSIFRFIYRKTDDEEITADLTSKVFLNAMNAIKKYEYRGFSFGTWLYKIASNETFKYFREEKRKLLSLESERVNHLMNCSQLEDEEEKLELLTSLIATLSDIEVRILELKYFENKSFTEIAFIVDQKESAVKMRLYRSLNKLKERYEVYAKTLDK